MEGHGPGFFTVYNKAASNEPETTRNELNSLSCALNGVWELKQTRFCVLLVVFRGRGPGNAGGGYGAVQLTPDETRGSTASNSSVPEP